ncbi:MAG: acyl-CoA dehydrogenase family protein [Sphingomonas sp.]|uniref:acyl-CoA dehydrogenase family protein n=1 Tax=Sphingomonas sp. TaxID=28214 RepID=UPI003F80F020
MDFTDSPDEAAYRARARAWLDENAPEVRFSDTPGRENEEEIRVARDWQARKADAGFACITWPVEWGGPGGTPSEQIIFEEEERKRGAASGIYTIGLGMCVPTIMTAGREGDKKRFVGPALRGEEIWCQLFSEPSAGSDVAASRTRASRVNDGSGDWLVNGQKVWTSGAHYSDFGLLLTRTDPDVPKHSGLTMFWIDMKAPGVEVKPIHQASGGSDFNEVYFTDLRLTDEQRIGGVGEGWQVALITLMNERLSVGGGLGPDSRELLDLVIDLPYGSDARSVLDDGGFREKFANWYVASQGLKLARLRTRTALSRGQTPGPEASIGKLISARLMQDMATEAIDRLDQHGIVMDDDALALSSRFQHSFFWGAALRIAGGSDEILKNIVAERVLGLPLEPRLDRDVAFKDLPRGV